MQAAQSSIQERMRRDLGSYLLRTRSTMSTRHGPPAHTRDSQVDRLSFGLEPAWLAGSGGASKPPGFVPRPEGSPHYRRWRPFFLISRAIVDRSLLFALTQ